MTRIFPRCQIMLNIGGHQRQNAFWTLFWNFRGFQKGLICSKMAFWGPVEVPKRSKNGSGMPSRKILASWTLCGVRNQIWCGTRPPEGQKVSFRGRVGPPWTLIGPPKNPVTPPNPPKPFGDPSYNQWNPSSYLITYYCPQNTQIANET